MTRAPAPDPQTAPAPHPVIAADPALVADPALALRLGHDPFGRLVLTDPDGQTHVGLTPVRGFPFSAPTEWISLCDADGHEVVSVADIRQLPPEPRALLEAELARREFIPVIRRIHRVSPGAEPTDWHVETDRGETRFQLTSEDHIRRLDSNRALITDSHGVRYQIPNLTTLDPQTRRILRRYL
jgi:hypothetical protein